MDEGIAEKDTRKKSNESDRSDRKRVGRGRKAADVKWGGKRTMTVG